LSPEEKDLITDLIQSQDDLGNPNPISDEFIVSNEETKLKNYYDKYNYHITQLVG
jgi:hypothetical protein